jgi:hypothetical protein
MIAVKTDLFARAPTPIIMAAVVAAVAAPAMASVATQAACCVCGSCASKLCCGDKCCGVNSANVIYFLMWLASALSAFLLYVQLLPRFLRSLVLKMGHVQ